MANFPGSFDSFTTLVDNVDDVLASHQNTRGSAIVALEQKVGLDSSPDSNSIDYFLRHAAGRFRTHDHSGGVNGPNIPVANVIGAVQTTNDQTIDGVKTFSSIPVLPASDPATANQATRKSYVDGKAKKSLIFVIAGAAAVGTNSSGRFKMDFAGTITKVKAYAKTAPVGASLIFDINKNGTTIFTTQASRPAITTGNNEATDVTNMDVTSFSANDNFTIDIDAVGSTTAGSDITVMVEISY